MLTGLFSNTLVRPWRSFVGKVMLWFWATVLLVIFSIASLAWLVSQQRHISPADKHQQRILHSFAARMQDDAKTPQQLLNTRWQRQRDRSQWLITDNTGQVVAHNGRSLPNRALDDLFSSAVSEHHDDNQTRIYIWHGPDYDVIGPLPVFSAAGDYQLHLLLARPGGMMDALRFMPNSGKIAIALLVTLLMSWLLARWVNRPIRRLHQAFAALEHGQLDYRLNEQRRRDEFGMLFRQFDAMSARLAQTIASQRRLTADISHELRTPLTRLQMLLGLAADAEQQHLQDYLQRAEAEGDKLNELIERLLTFTAMQAADNRYPMQQQALPEIWQQCLEAALFEAGCQNKVLCHNDIPAVTVLAHAGLLQSALDNLLRNAIKYARHQVSCQFECESQWLRVTISDDGAGVSDQHLALLSQPFYRADHARDLDSGGVGLGLAITEEAIRLHQGELILSHAASGGLQAQLTLPLVQH
ncbi:ATP-binding protein [Idiomarina xiamenensis]|uniref:histidine kinase n=1 Tax=Idiomarina xiamenensis 10-D-4 TaxID=740709 RepID=K2K1C4_9GAMM|nr:ATP-binding protein [Idiomarina xiamenensis]EKE81523.1 sensor histidine kinase [Idiomarina xiamenensis 10-D-4]